MKYFLLTAITTITFQTNAQIKSGQHGTEKSPVNMSIKEKDKKANTSVSNIPAASTTRTEPAVAAASTATNSNQSTIAKFVFEEAEAAYAKGDYVTAQVKINETERLLGSHNPRTLHLKILTEHKLFESDPAPTFEKLETLRKNCDYYLTGKYANDVSEEKLRDIYKVSVKLKEYPATRQAFLEKGDKLKREAEEIKLKEAQAKAALDKNFSDFVYFNEYELGITLSEAKAKFRDFFKKTQKVPTDYGEAVATSNLDFLMDLDNESMMGFYIQDERLYGYYGRIFVGADNSSFSKSKNKTSAIVQRLDSFFGFKGVEIKESISSKNTSGIKTTYTWERNGKMLKLEERCETLKGVSYGGIWIYSQDKKFL